MHVTFQKLFLIFIYFQGDSGGPLMIYSPDTKKWELIGVLSGGKRIFCGDHNTITFYVNIRNYRPWILKQLISENVNLKEQKNINSSGFVL